MANKKAQSTIGISFGVIFSIIIIIAIVGVAIFAITNFLDLNKCAQTGLFYNDIQNEINKAWASSIYNGEFPDRENTIALPKKINKVCFGALDQTSLPQDQETQNNLKLEYGLSSDNIFLYPPEETCPELSLNTLNNVEISEFFCIENNDQFKIKLKFNQRENTKVELKKI